MKEYIVGAEKLTIKFGEGKHKIRWRVPVHLAVKAEITLIEKWGVGGGGIETASHRLLAEMSIRLGLQFHVG